MRSFSTMFTHSLALSICLMQLRSVVARSWADVINKTIYESLLIDPYREQFLHEVDPSNFTSTTIQIITSHTVAPSVGASLDGCSDAQILHVIRMYDSWGDGWDYTKLEIKVKPVVDWNITVETKGDNSTLTSKGNRHLSTGGLFSSFSDEEMMIATLSDHNVRAENISSLSTTIRTFGEQNSSSNNIFAGSLVDGSSGNSTICLEVGKCYQVTIGGGLWPDEVKWDIRQTISSSGNEGWNPMFLPIAKGSGANICQFSVQDPESGNQACEFSCERNWSGDSFANLTDIETELDLSQLTLSPTDSDKLNGDASNTTYNSSRSNGEHFNSSLADDPTFWKNLGNNSNSTYSSASGTASPSDTPVDSPVEKDSRSQNTNSSSGTANQTLNPTPSFVPTVSLYPTITSFPTWASLSPSPTTQETPIAIAPSSSSAFTALRGSG